MNPYDNNPFKTDSRPRNDRSEFTANRALYNSRPSVLKLRGEMVRIDISEDAPGTARVFGGLS